MSSRSTRSWVGQEASCLRRLAARRVRIRPPAAMPRQNAASQRIVGSPVKTNAPKKLSWAVE